jgi:hypothetical protein
VRSWDERRRDVESRLDALAEMSRDTGGDVSPTEASLTVADDLLDYLVAYCRFPAATHKKYKGAAWREASGQFCSLKLRLSTAARRYCGAAA